MLRSTEPALFFLHVPKCAGTSVGLSLEAFASFPREEMTADLGVDPATLPSWTTDLLYDHPALGPIKLNHIPLAILADRFPAVWGTLSRSASFVVLREPRDRFVSGVLQRLREFEGVGASAVSDARIRDEAARACEWLAGRGPFCDVEHVHLARQSDFCEHGGRVIHARLFPLERLGALYDWLRDAHGLAIPRPEPRRVGRRPRGWLRPLHPIASAAGRHLLGRRLRGALYPLWLRSGAFVEASGGYGRIAFPDDVERFVREHYARDRALHEEALRQAGGGPEAAPREARPEARAAAS